MCSILCYAGKDVTKETMEGYLLKTKMRGPDAQQVVETEFGYLGFARLAIMGLTPDGMQPFQRDGSWVICNGEIYGFRKIKKELEERGYQFQSGSDCEVLLPLYEEYGLEMFSDLVTGCDQLAAFVIIQYAGIFRIQMGKHFQSIFFI